MPNLRCQNISCNLFRSIDQWRRHQRVDAAQTGKVYYLSISAKVKSLDDHDAGATCICCEMCSTFGFGRGTFFSGSTSLDLNFAPLCCPLMPRLHQHMSLILLLVSCSSLLVEIWRMTDADNSQISDDYAISLRLGSVMSCLGNICMCFTVTVHV